MHVETIEIEPIEAPLPMDFVARIVIRGTGLTERALPFAAELGTQPVYLLMPGIEEGVLIGFLRTTPSDGDELRIGRVDQSLTDTGVTVQTGIA